MIEVKKGKNNTFQFSLKTAEGKTLLKSVEFETKAEIENTVKELQPLANKQHCIERKTNYDGHFLFKLKDKNGKVIGNSLLYDSEAGMENGISNLRKRITSLITPP